MWFADFGQAAYGNLKVEFAGDPPTNGMVVALGEKLAKDGAIDRHPPGSVNFREIKLVPMPGQRVCQLTIPSKPFHRGAASVKTPAPIGEVTVFRYAEIATAAPVTLRQLAVQRRGQNGA